MKYRVLLIGNNRGVIKEFFTYMDYDFESLSSSEHYDDIMRHIKYVQPNVIVYCLLQEKPDDIKCFINMTLKQMLKCLTFPRGTDRRRNLRTKKAYPDCR